MISCFKIGGGFGTSKQLDNAYQYDIVNM